VARYVGIDPSTKTGLVILDEEGSVIESEEVTKEGADPQRMSSLIDYIVSKIQLGDRVGIEGFSFASKGQGVDFQYGLGWALRIALFKKGIHYIEPAPTQVKKFATGKGTADKTEVALGLFKRYGYENKSDNVRDAFTVAQIVRGYFNQEKLVSHQREVIGAMKNPVTKKSKK